MTRFKMTRFKLADKRAPSSCSGSIWERTSV